MDLIFIIFSFFAGWALCLACNVNFFWRSPAKPHRSNNRRRRRQQRKDPRQSQRQRERRNITGVNVRSRNINIQVFDEELPNPLIIIPDEKEPTPSNNWSSNNKNFIDLTKESDDNYLVDDNNNNKGFFKLY